MIVLKLTMRARDASEAGEIVGDVSRSRQLLDNDEISIHYSGKSNRPGMTGVDILLGFAIGIVSGVPAGVIANHLYAYLTRGKHSVKSPSQAEPAVTKAELESMIERAMKMAADQARAETTGSAPIPESNAIDAKPASPYSSSRRPHTDS